MMMKRMMQLPRGRRPGEEEHEISEGLAEHCTCYDTLNRI